MNKKTTMMTIAALVVGLAGGAVATYSWVRSPQRSTAQTGSEVWTFEDASGAPIRTTPLVVGDTVYIVTVTTGQIYAVEAVNGDGSLFFDPTK